MGFPVRWPVVVVFAYRKRVDGRQEYLPPIDLQSVAFGADTFGRGVDPAFEFGELADDGPAAVAGTIAPLVGDLLR